MKILETWYLGKNIKELLNEETPTLESIEKSSDIEFSSHMAARDNQHQNDEYGVREGLPAGRGRKHFTR